VLVIIAVVLPQHGGRDRHFCIGVSDIGPLVERLKAAGIPYTMSMSGRPAVFFRDPGECHTYLLFV
jgi:glyoxylase I family protein